MSLNNRSLTAHRALVVWLACAGLATIASTPADADSGVYFFRDRSGVMHFTNVPTDNRYRGFTPSLVPRVRLSFGRRTLTDSFYLASREPPAGIKEMIEQVAARYGVEPALVHAIVRAESDFDHLAVSPAGARGLMQLMPGTASLVGVRNVFHPRENLDGGVYYLRSMLDRFGGDVRLALAAYNAGPGAVESYRGMPPYAETIEYVTRVFRFRQQYLRRQPDRLALATSQTR